jgi:glutamate carboxypeptidase
MTTSLTDFLTSRLPNYLDILHQMVAINTFTANAEGVNRLGDYCNQVFAGLGMQPEFVPSTNPAFGRHLFLSNHDLQAGNQARNVPTMALIAHLDTVFPPEEEALNDFRWRVLDERAYGPGTVDIKGGIVMIYIVLEALYTLYPQEFNKIRWLVCLDASEETLSDDFATLCRERLPTSTLACLVFEGGTPHPDGFQLVTARKGRAEFEVTCEGRGAHAGNYHRLGANAIVQLAHTVSQIAEFTDYAKSLTFNVGTIQGGSVVNRVPHHAEAKVEMRAFDPDIFETGLQRMVALDGSSQVSSEDGYPCRVSVQVRSRSEPWPRNQKTDRLFDLWVKAADGLGFQILPEQRGGLSDGNLLWQHFPTLDGLGPTGNNAHCSERSEDGSKEQEYTVISSFVPKASLNIEALIRLIKRGANF